MKHLLLIVIAACVYVNALGQSSKIGVKYEGVIINNTGASTPDPSAVLDVNSQDKGVIFPRLTAEQKNQITNPAEGLLIYNLTTKFYEYFNGTEWLVFGTAQIPPNAPSGLVATFVSISRIDLSWTDNSDDETGFIIEKRIGAGGTWTEIITVAANTTTFSDDDLGSEFSEGETYYYRLKATNNGLLSEWSNEINVSIPPFISTWKTDNAGTSGNTQIKLPLESSGTYNFSVDWGDGNSDVITAWNQTETTHTYATSGTYTVSIAGTINGWRFNNTGDKLKITNISQWGSLLLGNNGGYFYGCSNLDLTATDTLDTSSITNFSSAWNYCKSLTAFPLIDTSAGTDFSSAWNYCSSLTSFPLIDTGSGTNFSVAWSRCSSLTSFPLIDTSSGTNFSSAWSSCNNLISFPLIDTSSGTNFSSAWSSCNNLISFPLIDTSVGIDFSYAWGNCSSLTSFPLIDTSAGTNFYDAWKYCSSLTSFPLIDTGAGIFFSDAWKNCSSLTSFPLLNTSSGMWFLRTWENCSSLTSFPLIDTSSGTTFSRAWRNCNSLTSFPLLNTSVATNFSYAWSECTSLTSFPLLDTGSGTDFSYAWSLCTSLSTFPLLDTSAGIKFSSAWNGCNSLTSFPLLDVSSGALFYSTWLGCSALTSFPQLDTSSGGDFRYTWRNCTSLTSFPTLDLEKMHNGTGCFENTNIGATSYSNLLVDIESKNSNTGVTFHGGNATYNAGASTTARAALVANSWTITDGGQTP
ncbi:fibronectin type III domain-containing protein [Reichenbachiella sp. MALMAid0571]|uniref:fibronectin type III domain-containing protein n=1 Tax=Reichenbachiella sp. MALMAid0571 TaxID=3143939 RepID=UPI0032DEE53F